MTTPSLRPHQLQILDSWTRTKRPFEPLTPGHVGIYVCGPTVYSDTHLGHAKSYISFDVVVRYFRWLGYRVRYVQNITDVGHLTDNADEGEDKLLKRARLDRVHPMELAETYTRLYFRDMDALGVTRPDISPRATQHVPEQLAIIRQLIQKGHAYEVGGSVYFSVKSWSEYGKLSGRDIEESEEGTRVSVRSDKRDPRDFALWKAAEGGHILRWDTEWGPGFPGWHIECSAMSQKYLGDTFDIHGGGLDNQFPHHECEIAQSHAAGVPFARFWMHNNLITVDGQKMSKSLGNFTSVAKALEKHAPETVRFWVLSTHYRSPANYADDALTAAKGGLDRLLNCYREVHRKAGSEAPGALPDFAVRAERAFVASMDDDFNTPLALGALFDLVRETNAALAGGQLAPPAAAAVTQLMASLGGDVLGVLGPPGMAETSGSVGPLVELLIDLRKELKSRKAFDLSDRVRDGLLAQGIELKDGKEGTVWTKKN